jgi:hypothetical protein
MVDHNSASWNPVANWLKGLMPSAGGCERPHFFDWRTGAEACDFQVFEISYLSRA